MSEKPKTRERGEIPERYRWNLEDIYADEASWECDYHRLEDAIGQYAKLKGTLEQGPKALLRALELYDELGQLSYRIWFYPSLRYDEDQRNNEVNARRQQAQIVMAKASEASAWFNPELIEIPLETVRGWMEHDQKLAVYRFAIEEIYRQQEHVLDQQGERLLSLSTRLNSAPSDSYAALSTADMRYPEVTLSDGTKVTVSYGQYRAILATRREQADRARAFEALYGCYGHNINTYAALYNGVVQRDIFLSRSRAYATTLAAALHGNNIPEQVVETLISTTRAGTEPLRRYHRLRKRVLGLEHYHLYDGSIPLVDLERSYPYSEVLDWVTESVEVLGEEYQTHLRRAFDERWIDVYESDGKRSGAYSAPVYGVHPYMLLNYNDTLDDLFTLAHEMGHSIHTIYSHRSQPFVYASYTIFVAEVASTLNEGLLLDYMLGRSDDPRERALLLQHAIDAICGTFYTQVLFADWELRAHRLAEEGRPLTADVLGELYVELLGQYYGDCLTVDEPYRLTWARIPHFFRSPYYVYQYATCFASSAVVLRQLADSAQRDETRQRYLGLLSAGSSDHPMDLLRAAGIDLSDPATVGAVVDQLDGLVGKLEQELERC